MAGGLLFVALSLLPSMLPKSSVIEGVVVGITFVVGYGLGAAMGWFWRFLELPVPSSKLAQILPRIWWLTVLGLLALNLWRHLGWQNSVREVFGLEASSPWVWVAAAVAAAVLRCWQIERRSTAPTARIRQPHGSPDPVQ